MAVKRLAVLIVLVLLVTIVVSDVLAKKTPKKNGGKVKKVPKGKKMEIAVQDENAFTTDDVNTRNIAYAQAKAIGATVIRKMLSLHLIHPCRGTAAVDEINKMSRFVSEARSHGMKVQLTICGVAANWGLPRGCAGKWKPTGEKPNIKNYQKLVSKYVQYFSKLGVKRFSSWNEPNHPAFLCAGKSKVSSSGDVDSTVCADNKSKRYLLYGKLHKAAWGVVQKLKKAKKIPKSVELWFGEFSGNGMKAAETIFKKLKIAADAYSFHPYQYCTPPNTFKAIYAPGSSCHKTTQGGIASAKQTQAFIRKWAKKGRFRTPKGGIPPLYLTEFGYHRLGVNAIPEPYRAKWYPMAMTVAAKAHARGMVLYQMFPSGPGAPPTLWDTGFLAYGGGASPSSNALRAWAQKRGYKVA